MSANVCVTLPGDNQISVRIATYADAATQTEVRRRQTRSNHSRATPTAWSSGWNHSRSTPIVWDAEHNPRPTGWGSRTQTQTNANQSNQNQNQDDNPWAAKPKRELVRDPMFYKIFPQAYFQEMEEEDSFIERLRKQSIQYIHQRRQNRNRKRK